jgi:acetoin utilization protein AcuC
LKGIISLGKLSFLASFMPSCLRKSKLTTEEKTKIGTRDTAGTQNRTLLAVLYRQELKECRFGHNHILFPGTRYQAFIQFLQENLPEDDNYRILKANPATDEDLLLICSKEYIDFTKGYFKAANLGLEYPGDFSKFHDEDNEPDEKPGKLEAAARLFVGQAKKACDLVQLDKFKKAVTIGGGEHHAMRDYGQNFCIYNDVAFCGLYLMQNYGLERILILDTDAHAGDGTSDYFYKDPRVLFVDLHQDPTTIDPWTGFAHQIGSGEGKGFTINIPMPVGAGYDSYRLAFETVVEPVVQEFKPQIIIRNGGSDPHYSDMLCDLELPIAGFRMIGEKVREMSSVCGGRVIDLIGSGYNRKFLCYAWLALIIGLGDIEFSLEELDSFPEPSSMDPSSTETKSVEEALIFAKTEGVIKEVRDYLKDYWPSLR